MNIAELSGNLHDKAYCKRKRAEARKITNGAPSCATFLSLCLMDIGVVDEVRTWTSDIVGNVNNTGLLERECGAARIRRAADVKPLDIIVTLDLNKNNAPDHVGFALNSARGKDLTNPFVLFCDNQGTYWRNLGKSGWHNNVYIAKTPMAYALRLTSDVFTDDALATQRQALVDLLPAVYELAQAPDVLSADTLGLLNQFRFSPELQVYEPKGG